VSYNLIFMLLPMAQAFASSLYPSLARETDHDVNAIQGVVRRAIKYLLVASLPIAMGLTVLGDKIIIFLYTEEFAPAIPALYVLAWVLPCLFISEMLGRTTNVVNRERDRARLDVIGASISVALNLALVPTMGLLGAALATLIGRLTRVILYWRLLGSDLLVGDQTSALVRLGLATVLMGGVVLLLREAHLFLAIGVGAITYGGLLFALRVLDRVEMAHLTLLVMRKAN
jgi:O-antigen/teichoic acid export membrane protein